MLRSLGPFVCIGAIPLGLQDCRISRTPGMGTYIFLHQGVHLVCLLQCPPRHYLVTARDGCVRQWVVANIHSDSQYDASSTRPHSRPGLGWSLIVQRQFSLVLLAENYDDAITKLSADLGGFERSSGHFFLFIVSISRDADSSWTRLQQQ
ncbi:unnamed protein product [Periconia digitata]|uniref:Uncharacterized protein n=1 Tax=Periconia digitata TaxID=1303443 RepID=A0A9W4UPB3_9PLEO|nr:unnamed protein product [Periconia digitata]